MKIPRLMALVLVLCWHSCSLCDPIQLPVGSTGLGIIVQDGEAPLLNLKDNPAATKINVVAEDQNYNVPLGFKFPFFGKEFDNSWMSENGVVAFENKDPYAFCCNALPLNSADRQPFSYAIFPMWTDWTTEKTGSLYTLGTDSSMSYGWYDVREFGTPNTSSFELTINADGSFKTTLNNVLVTNHYSLSGFVGNSYDPEERHKIIFHGNEGLVPERSLIWNVATYDPTNALPSFDQRRVGYDYTIATDINAFINKEDISAFDPKKQEVPLTMLQTVSDQKLKQSKSDDDDKIKKMSFNNDLFFSLNNGKFLKEIDFYKDEAIYKNQKNVDNTRVLKSLASDGKMRKIIDSQWELK